MVKKGIDIILHMTGKSRYEEECDKTRPKEVLLPNGWTLVTHKDGSQVFRSPGCNLKIFES